MFILLSSHLKGWQDNPSQELTSHIPYFPLSYSSSANYMSQAPLSMLASSAFVQPSSSLTWFIETSSQLVFMILILPPSNPFSTQHLE